jgi:hypothetical protein
VNILAPAAFWIWNEVVESTTFWTDVVPFTARLVLASDVPAAPVSVNGELAVV